MNEIYAIIDLLGAVPGYFFAVVIGIRAKSQYTSRILCLGLFAYSSFLLCLFLLRLGYLEHAGMNHVHMNTFVHMSWPLFYLYLHAITSDIEEFKKEHLLHLLPFALYSSAVLVQFLFFAEHHKGFYIAAMICTAVVAGGYSVATLAILLGYRKNAASFPSEARRLKLTWLTTNIVLWFVLVGVQIGFFILRALNVDIPEGAAVVHGLFINIGTVSWVYVLGYFAMSHPGLLHMQAAQPDAEKEAGVLPLAGGSRGEGDGAAGRAESERAQQGTLPQDLRVENLENRQAVLESVVGEEEALAETTLEIDPVLADEVVHRLDKVMEQQRPYLDNQLTLSKLAKAVNRPSYLVGKIINKHLGKNFLTYINEYRAEAVMRKLTSDLYKDERILDIAFECGFRTKSAFNAFFKKHTGETPSDFRRRHGSAGEQQKYVS